MSRQAPFPFIVACGRSGTTLLRAMLERGGQVAIPPESYFPVSLYERHGRAAFDPASFGRDLATNVRFQGWGIDVPDTVVAAGSYPDAIRAVYAAYASSRGASRAADKTPPFVLHMDLLARLFPEARFVHLIRDGRDVARSLVATSFGPNGLARAAEVWVRRVSRGRAAGEALAPNRYREVRYEALVEDPEATAREVCGFLELDFSDAMLRPEEQAAALPERERAHHANLGKPITPGLRDWRRDMRPGDVALVEAVAGDLLHDLGYERRVRVVPLGARARAAIAGTGSGLARRTRRVARGLWR